MQDEIVRALGETFVMVGLSTTIAVIFGTLLGVLLFRDFQPPASLQQAGEFPARQLSQPDARFPLRHPDDCHDTRHPRHRRQHHRPDCRLAGIERVRPVLLCPALVEQNLREVPKGVIEAATAMGASPLAIVRKVLLNEARAGMVSSITVLAIGLLSYSAAAGMIGGGGLGDLAIRYGYYRYQTEVIIFIVAILVLLVILIQSTGNALARKLDKR